MLKLMLTLNEREKKSSSSENFLINHTSNGWVNAEIMVSWFKNIVLPYVGKNKALLIFDSFRGQTSALFEKELCKHDNIDIAIIPGGLTGILQPLDVSVNKSFKNKILDAYLAWLDQNANMFFERLIRPAQLIIQKIAIRTRLF